MIAIARSAAALLLLALQLAAAVAAAAAAGSPDGTLNNNGGNRDPLLEAAAPPAPPARRLLQFSIPTSCCSVPNLPPVPTPRLPPVEVPKPGGFVGQVIDDPNKAATGVVKGATSQAQQQWGRAQGAFNSAVNRITNANIGETGSS